MRTRLDTLLGTLLGTALVAAALTAVPATPAASAPAASAPAAGKVGVTNGCVKSAPEPGKDAKVKICYTLFRPARATSKHPVPLLMHSHGWGGSRTTKAGGVREFLDAGYGVLSFDQRGWGASGGFAHVENPNLEGKDVRRSGPAGRQPRLGEAGRPRRPSAWRDRRELRRRLPVPRRLRVAPHPAASRSSTRSPPRSPGTTSGRASPPRASSAPSGRWRSAPPRCRPTRCPHCLQGAGRGRGHRQWPNGSIPGTENMVWFFAKNGPKWHVDHGRRLDIPVLFGQGTTDTLFPLQQGLANWQHALTPRARRRSIFVAYNGGHVLPRAAPRGRQRHLRPVQQEAGRRDLRRPPAAVHQRDAQGPRRTGLKGCGRLHLATPDSTCTTVDSVAADQGVRRRHGRHHRRGRPPAAPSRSRRARSGSRAAVPHRQRHRARRQNRAFYGLAIGTTPLTPTWSRTTCCRSTNPPRCPASTAGSRCPRWP